jgi:hypothetical protein
MVQMMKRSRKQRVDAAISYALERRWDLAAAENRTLLEDFPDDIEAANRLGKALTELGDLEAAEQAYRRSLEIDATNAIARRNLTRIEEMRAQTATPKGKRSGSGAAPARRARAAASPPPPEPRASGVSVVRPHSLIEESGKSAELVLQEPDMAALRRIAAGDPAELMPTPRGVSIRDAGGTVLGHVEPRAGLRLRRLIEGGNQYAVVVRRVSDDGATIYIREVSRSPEQKDEPSFLPPATAARRRAAPRAYTKSSIVRYQAGPDSLDDDEGGDDSWAPRASAASDDDEMEEAGFGDASIQDDDDDVGLLGDDDDEPLGDDDDEL